MLVDVICLREGGIKLAATELAGAKRAHLRVLGRVARVTNDPSSPTTVGDVFPPLEDFLVYRIEGDNMVLRGWERPGQLRLGPPQLQAWWCRIIQPA